MFGKKKKPLFGAGIEADCALCANWLADGQEGRCRLELNLGEKGCKKFTYDPLKREPRKAPPLREFDPEEFKI